MHAVRSALNARYCGGFTLAEVLVALLVVALGIAGAAGVQALALRSGREAGRIADGVQLAATLSARRWPAARRRLFRQRLRRR
jgi:type IV pilus assembly protein PilV